MVSYSFIFCLTNKMRALTAEVENNELNGSKKCT